MSQTFTISEAKTQLSKLIAAAERGEEISIRRGGKLVVRLVPVDAPSGTKPSPVGALKGKTWMADDWDELGPEWDPYLP